MEPIKRILAVQNLTIAYGNKVVVENCNIDIYAGKITAILGGNGGGKSSILKLLGCSNEIKCKAEGEIVYYKDDGTAVDLRRLSGDALKTYRQTIAYVGQEDDAEKYYLATVESILKNSLLFSLGRKLSKEEQTQKVQELLTDFGLQQEGSKNGKEKPFGKRLFSSLSGGQKRLVSLLEAFIREDATLYLIDEPINNLDSKNAMRVANFITKLHARRPNVAIVLVTHCRMFPTIDIAYEIDKKTVKRMEVYECKNCFGEVDENNLYTIE